MKRIVFMILCLVACQGLVACTQTVSHTGSQNTSGATSSVVGDTQVYLNTKLGFKLVFPSGWYLAGMENSDPHFYENMECANGDNVPCAALEIQSEDPVNQEKYMNEATSNNLHPVKKDSLIPGAIVIQNDMSGPFEGWNHEYHVFFPGKQFLVLTNSEKVESSILSTMRLND